MRKNSNSKTQKIIENGIIPQISFDLRKYFVSKPLVSVISKKPSNSTLISISQKILPSIPVDQRADFFRYSLSSALSVNNNREVWKAINSHILPQIPKYQYNELFQYSLIKPLQLKTNTKIWKAVSKDVLPILPQEKRIRFIESSLPYLLRTKISKENWKIITKKILPNIEPEERNEFFEQALPGILKKSKNPITLNQLAQIIKTQIPKEHRLSFLSKAILNTDLNDHNHIKNQARIAKEIYSKLDNSQLSSRIVGINFGNLTNDKTIINHNNLKLIDSKTPLEEDRFTIIYKELKPKSFSNWQRAYSQNIPVEPILNYKKLRNGNFGVYTKFLGKTLEEKFKYGPKNEVDLSDQKDHIINKIEENSIEHHRMHDGNFVVVSNGKNSKVHLIDF